MSAVTVRRLAGALGAEIDGVDLSANLSDGTIADIRAALNEHQVIMATLASTPSKTEAAKRLGISPRTLRYKMAQLREHGLAMAAAC